MARRGGFTLVEMLVVLGIFSIIGLIGARIVNQVLANYATLSDRGERLADVQRAMLILQRDLLQLSGRGIRDGLGDPVEPVLIGAEGMIEFSRLGWRNPLGRPRAEVQRVGYVLDDDVLYRAYWLVLDRAPDTEPLLQELLSGVKQAEFFALDASGNEHSFWPPAGSLRGNPSTALAAVVLRIDVEPFGVVERIWPVPDPDAGVGLSFTSGPPPGGGTGQEAQPELPEFDPNPPGAPMEAPQPGR